MESFKEVSVKAGKYSFEENVDTSGSRAVFMVEKGTPWSVIKELDDKKVFLRWNIEPGMFQPLAANEWSQLSQGNKDTYKALENAAYDLERKKESPFRGVEVLGPRVKREATKKLSINKAIPGRVTGWKRPDELVDAAARGWRVARADDGYVPNFGTGTGSNGSVVVKTRDGLKEDLILMDRDEQLHNKELWDNDARARARTQRGLESFQNQAAEQGIKTFVEEPGEEKGVETPRSRERRGLRK